MTCNECGASLRVTTHHKPNNNSTTNQFSIKMSMHEKRCSLRKVASIATSLAHLPPLGRSALVCKRKFTVVRI